jgi:hypothetical protein
VRQLEASLAWEILVARHQMGAAVVLASAASVAAGAYALPVYEIYKVGEDLFWHNGLDFFARYGLAPTFIPHWNNAEGGEDLDTSRCYIGDVRFQAMRELLPADQTVVGIDEHTALIIDPANKTCQAMGLGGVVLVQGSEIHRFEAGQTFDLGALGTWQMPAPDDEIHPDVLKLIQDANDEALIAIDVPQDVKVLTEARTAARARKDWTAADQLRDQIVALGWRVLDTPDGPQVEPVVIEFER